VKLASADDEKVKNRLTGVLSDTGEPSRHDSGGASLRYVIVTGGWTGMDEHVTALAAELHCLFIAICSGTLAALTTKIIHIYSTELCM